MTVSLGLFVQLGIQVPICFSLLCILTLIPTFITLLIFIGYMICVIITVYLAGYFVNLKKFHEFGKELGFDDFDDAKEADHGSNNTLQLCSDLLVPHLSGCKSYIHSCNLYFIVVCYKDIVVI